MGKVTGFLEYERLEEGYEPPQERLKNWKEFVIGLNADQAKVQGARCMDCGTPFCNSGCPVNNIIPDFNDLVYRGDWQQRHRPCCTRPTTSPSSPAASARRPARRPARSTSTTTRWASRASSTPSSTAPGPKAGSAAAAARQDRQEGGRGRLRPGRPGGRAAAGARRPRRDGVREEQPHRRPAALRHPRLQDGEVAHRPPRRADAGRGRGLPHRRAGGRCPRTARSPTTPRKPSAPSS
jgi:hypothetical protein